ncbi:hypothetical protein MRX96_059219 [Rhipicephalus microplus]
MAQCLARMGSGGAARYVGEYRPEKQEPAAADPRCGGSGMEAGCLPPFMMAAMQSQLSDEPPSCFVVAAVLTHRAPQKPRRLSGADHFSRHPPPPAS